LNAIIFKIQARVEAIPVTRVAITQKAGETGKCVSYKRQAVPKITMQIKLDHHGINMESTPDYWIFEVLKSPNAIMSGAIIKRPQYTK
jgi:hypothetical protein